MKPTLSQHVVYRIPWSTGIFMLLSALVIDALQFIISLAVWILLTAISTVVTAAVAGVAGFVLGLGVGAAFNFLATLVALALFWTWFFFRGVSFIRNWRLLAAFVGGALGELIPFINNLPWWTIGVLLTILFSRADDRRAAAGKKRLSLGKPRLKEAFAQKALAATPLVRQFARPREAGAPPQGASYALNPARYVRARGEAPKSPRPRVDGVEPARG